MKTRSRIKLLAIFIVFVLNFGWVTLFNINNTYAENGGATLLVTPMSQKIILVPGERYIGTIEIANGASATENLQYTARIGSYNEKGGGDSLDDYGTSDVDNITSYNEIMGWVTLDNTEGVVEPNNKAVITYMVEVPSSAPSGAQYFSILVSEKEKNTSSNKDSSGNASVGIKSKFQLASVVVANVAGETVEKGSIKSNEMPTMLTTNKLEATSMVRNDGNIYTDATYTLQVWPMFSDEEICTNEEKAESTTVLPNTERYHVQTCDLPSVGIFKAKQVVKIFSEESVLEKTIFVCPIWLMVLVLIVVVGIVVGIIIYIKKRKTAKQDD